MKKNQEGIGFTKEQAQKKGGFQTRLEEAMKQQQKLAEERAKSKK